MPSASHSATGAAARPEPAGAGAVPRTEAPEAGEIDPAPGGTTLLTHTKHLIREEGTFYPPAPFVLGFRLQGLGFRVWGLVFGV